MSMFDQTQQPMGAAPIMPGYQYNGYNQPLPKVMNVLSEEEIKELQQQRSQFSLGLTEREAKQAACNHRSIDGMQDSLVYDQETGIARCTICGYEFRPIEADASYETIKDAADRLVDILQTIKIMYTDLPANAAREYFQIIPLIGKVPQLFEFAAKNFTKHEYNQWSYNQHNMGGMAMLQSLNNMFGASFGGYQPGYGAPMQQPMGYAPGYQAPMQQAPVGYAPQPQGGNPFGYPGASQQPMAPGYQPQTAPGYQYQPGQAQPVAPTTSVPTAPAAPEANAATETVTQKVTV